MPNAPWQEANVDDLPARIPTMNQDPSSFSSKLTGVIYPDGSFDNFYDASFTYLSDVIFEGSEDAGSIFPIGTSPRHH